MNRRYLIGGGLAVLALTVALSLFGGRTYVDLRDARRSTATLQTTLSTAQAELALAKAEADSLRLVRAVTDTIYRTRVRTLPSDTVLVGLPAACDACVARSRAQDSALAAAADLIREDSTQIAAHQRTIARVTDRLRAADSAALDLRGALDRAARQQGGPRRILGIPLPEVVAGYGLSLSEGQIRPGPALVLGWKVSF